MFSMVNYLSMLEADRPADFHATTYWELLVYLDEHGFLEHDGYRGSANLESSRYARDAWGQPYVLVVRKLKDRDEYVILSSGRDRRLGTEDDLTRRMEFPKVTTGPAPRGPDMDNVGAAGA